MLDLKRVLICVALMALVTYVPDIVLCLPRAFMGYGG